MSKTFDAATSERLARELGSKPKACWANALDVLFALPGTMYVEGFLVLPEIPMIVEHGWCERSDTIIDTTPQMLGGRGTYFAGVRYSRRQARRLLKQLAHLDEPFPFVWHTHAYGFEHPDYDAARGLAEVHTDGRRYTESYAARQKKLGGTDDDN